ncbi:MAG: GerMN domain-containing protein [Clostridiales bacterium]
MKNLLYSVIIFVVISTFVSCDSNEINTVEEIKTSKTDKLDKETDNKTTNSETTNSETTNNETTNKETTNNGSNENKGNNIKTDSNTKDNIKSNVDVTLYFVKANTSDYEFETEIRNIEISNGAVAKAIVNELIKEHERNGIPQGTKIKGISFANGILQVDFSKEFIENMNLGSGYEVMMVYSIVNSLTELSNVNKVRILVDGSAFETGHVFYDKPMSKSISPIGN